MFCQPSTSYSEQIERFGNTMVVFILNQKTAFNFTQIGFKRSFCLGKLMVQSNASFKLVNLC